MTNLRTLVTGATGYIGGNLVPRLLEAGYPVRALVRDPARLEGRAWADQVEVAQGDVLVPETLPAALEGIDVAYYFIHSLFAGEDFHQLDLDAARNFSQAAQAAGVERLIYLGGLGDPADELSPHLRSRQETGLALREAGVPVTEFRSAIIIGAGSGSFEMIRYLTERIPLMVSPKWVFSQIQPIAIDDVLDYLVAALEVPESSGQVIEIGGTDVMSYGDTMLAYARARGLRRLMLPVPVLTPSLSSHWVGWVTPMSARLARPLIEGLRNEVVVRDDKAQRLFPGIQPMDYRTSLELALAELNPDGVDLDWIDAQVAHQADTSHITLTDQENVHLERRYDIIQAPPQVVYTTFAGLGGQQGWLYANWMWRLRGWVDRFMGGVGPRQSCPFPEEPEVGDTMDFFRVEAVESGRMLRLVAEVKMPGTFWIQFEAQPWEDGKTRLVQTIFFTPKGLLGFVYWHAFYHPHRLVFSGLIKSLKEQAEACMDEPVEV